MAKTVPLIRAANVLPFVRWLEMNKHDVHGYLDKSDLGYWFALSPLDPVPTLNAIELLRLLADDHGPDVGVKIVTQASVAELGYIGAVALGTRTPVESLQRISFAIPMHSSHETIRLETHVTHVTVSEKLHFKVDATSLHAVHVLFAAMLQQLCRFTGMQPPLLSRIDLTPHPDFGTGNLERHFGCPVYASSDAAVKVTIDGSVAYNPFRHVARDRLPHMSRREVPPLTDGLSMASSVRSVIAAMLHGGEPTVDRIARSSGLSVRSLQRRLTEEGTSVSKELDRVRMQLALDHFGADNVSLLDLSERLGYSAQSALTRAIRRLTGKTPSQLTTIRSD